MMRTAPRVPAPAVASASASPTPEAANPAPASSPAGVPASTPAPFAPLVAEPTPAAYEERVEVLANPDLELRLTNKGGGIREARLLHHAGEGGKGEVVLNAADLLPIGALVEQPSTSALPEFTFTREADGSVVGERKTPEGVTVRKRFSFPTAKGPKDNYVIEMQVDFRNDGAQAYTNPGYFVALGSTIPIHPSDLTTYTRAVWFRDGKPKSTDVNWFAAQKYPVLGIERRAEQKVFEEKINGAAWAAMSNQFFATIVTPLNGPATEIWARPFEVAHPDSPPLRGMEGAMGMPGFVLQPGETNTQRFQIYTGPKLYAQLAKFEHGEAAIMDFGMFKIVCQALLNFMNLLHSFVGNYGVAIVLMTVCVKAVLWPLQSKANKSMRKMSALAPKMQALKEKFKDDPTKMNTEVMKLYKEHGVNPVGGCLPMLIQFPIFIGLFTMLRQVAELRNESFLWVKDLSQPDTLFTIPGLGFIPVLGTPAGLTVNLLPILMGATQFWLMKMTPNTGDAMQRRVMMFMPLIFLVFCYNFAAALALYYTTQNLLSILQYWYNQKQPAPVLTPVVPERKRSGKGKK